MLGEFAGVENCLGMVSLLSSFQKQKSWKLNIAWVFKLKMCLESRVLEGIEVKIAAKQGKIEEEKNIDIQDIHFSRSLTLTALLGNYIIVVKMLWKSK